MSSLVAGVHRIFDLEGGLEGTERWISLRDDGSGEGVLI
jgi:hypothetical protein